MEISKPSKEEVALAVVKGGIGAIPIVGGMASELFGTMIPNRRMDRAEKMLSQLKMLMDNRSPKLLEEKVQEEAFFGLLEQGAIDAAKAATEERIKYIANILANGSESHKAAMAAKVCLNTIADMSDLEIATLIRIHDRTIKEKVGFDESDTIVLAHEWFGLPQASADNSVADDAINYSEFVQQAINRLIEKNIVFDFSGVAGDPDYNLRGAGKVIIAHILDTQSTKVHPGL